MVKVTEMLSDDPMGAMGHSMHPEDCERLARQMRDLLHADLWEEDKALNIAAFNDGIGNEPLMCVWPYLNAGERRAWKEYIVMARREGSWTPY